MTDDLATLRLLEQLIASPPVTPDDAGCQGLVTARRAPLGFACETLVCGPDDFRVTNLWAVHGGGMVWDNGNGHFPATTWQVSNIHAGTGALNVISGAVVVDCNFRFSTDSTPDQLKARLEAVLQRHGLDHQLAWTLGGSPFPTRPGTLSAALGNAIEAECGIRPVQSATSDTTGDTTGDTTSDTSDGRCIAPFCEQVVEFGPINATIHKIDDCVRGADIAPLTNIDRRTLEALLT